MSEFSIEMAKKMGELNPDFEKLINVLFIDVLEAHETARESQEVKDAAKDLAKEIGSICVKVADFFVKETIKLCIDAANSNDTVESIREDLNWYKENLLDIGADEEATVNAE